MKCALCGLNVSRSVSVMNRVEEIIPLSESVLFHKYNNFYTFNMKFKLDLDGDECVLPLQQ